MLGIALSSESAKAQQPLEAGIDKVISLLRDMHYSEAYAAYDNLTAAHINPERKLLIATVAFEHGDSSIFLKILLDLMAEHGFEDGSATRGMPFHEDISIGAHKTWYIQHLDSCRIRFINSHIRRFEVIRRIESIRQKDQLRGLIYASIADQEIADSIVTRIDSANLQELVDIARVWGLPNNFDDQLNAEGIVGLVLLHCGKNPVGFHERWNSIWPYLDKAFKEGKITNGFIYIYDQTLRMHSGQQYYGTLNGVPVSDPINLDIRRSEYGISP